MKQKWYNTFTFDGKTLSKVLSGGNWYQFVFFDEISLDE